jgi:transketolase
MRKQLVNSVHQLLYDNKDTILLLGDIGIFGFKKSFEDYPNRVYNIGILEQSMISLASGLSSVGFIPIIHTIAPFLVERALEQLKIDFGYQGLNGNFISVGASYDYSSLGGTHHCPGDIQQLLTIPNMEIIIPGSSEELNSLLLQGYNNGNPTYYRLSEFENEESHDVILGQGNLIKKGTLATIICVGNMLTNVIDATNKLDVTILYYTSINPFDEKLLINNFSENIIIIEPYYEGGLNYIVNKILVGKKYKLTNIGVPHNFLNNYGSKIEQDEKLGLNSKNLRKRIKLCL